MNISVVKTVTVDLLCSVIFFFCKRKIVRIIAIPYCSETKEVMQALEQKGQLCGGLSQAVVGVWGCSVLHIPSKEDISLSCGISLLKTWTECNQWRRAGL